MAETKFGTFTDLIHITEEHLRPIVSELKKVILDLHPGAYEVVRLGDRAATYGVGPKKMKEGYCYILPHKSWVNLGFYQGSMLSDDNNLLEGTGKKLRHIKIHTLEDIHNRGVKDLIRKAIEERKIAVN